jgi:hypothetical protein
MTRTLRALRANDNVMADIVERYMAYARRPGGSQGVRRDYLGIIDIIVLDPARGIGGIQVCGADFSGHRKKMTGIGARACITWLSCPGAWLELWGWRKVIRSRNDRRKVWRPRIHVFRITDFPGYDPTA